MPDKEKPYYYWSNTFRNKKGESLSICLEKYGTGVSILPPKIGNFVVEFIFLDKSRNFAKTWCLRCYDLETGINLPVKIYEENPDEKIYGKPKLNPVKIISKL